MTWLMWSGLGLNTLAMVWCCRRVETAARGVSDATAAMDSAAEVRPAEPDEYRQKPIGRDDDLPRAVALLLARVGGRAEFTQDEIYRLSESDEIFWWHNRIDDKVVISLFPSSQL